MERKYRSAIRRVYSEKLKEWRDALYDMYYQGKFPLMGYIIAIVKELEERDEREGL